MSGKKTDTTPQDKKLNPNNKKDESVKIDPNAFNSQIYLLDVFSQDENVVHEIQKTPNVNTTHLNVPILPQGLLENINGLIDRDFQQVQKFIGEIPPNEVAQLVPKISLFLVSSADPSVQLGIPLSDPATINKSSMGAGYYSGNTIGLRSLDMTLDGNRNPVFNKAYLVKMNIVLDSINTFTAPIPNSSAFGNLTYADLFRSGGSPGGLNDAFFLKLAISHGASPKSNISQKYGLNTDNFTTSLSLTLRQTSLSIEENLKTNVDVTFTGYEENLFERRDLFDFLGLDLQDAKNEQLDKIKKATNTKAIADKAAQKKAEKLLNVGQKQLDQSLVDQRRSVSKKFFQNFGKDADNFLLMFGEMEAKRRQGHSTGEIDIGRLYIDSFEGERAKKEALIQIHTGKVNLNDLRTAAEDVTFNIPEAKKELLKVIEENKNAELGKAKQDYDTDTASAKSKLDNIRMNEISRVLETMLFGKKYYDEEIIKSIDVSSEQLQKYFQAQRGGVPSELGNSSSVKDLQKSTDSKDASRSPAKKPNPKDDTVTPGEPDQKKIDEVTQKIKQLNREEQDRIKQLSKDGGKQEEDKKLKEIREKRKLLTTELNKISQKSKILGGTVEEIFKNLMDFKYFEYILFGDLLRLVFDQIYRTLDQKTAKRDGLATALFNKVFKGQSSIQGQILARSRILLTDITLPASGDTVLNIDKNLYFLPISIQNLKFMFADKLFGKSKSSFTVFEIIEEIGKMVSLSFQNKVLLLNDKSVGRKYSVEKATYSLKGEEPNYKIISSVKKQKDYKHGIVIYFKTKEQTTKRPGTRSFNMQNKIPHFYFGGYDRGAVKKIELELVKKGDMQLAVMEQLGEGVGKVIPAIFKTKIDLVACPVFHLGMEYYVATPTINNSSNSGASPWLFAQGYYNISNIVHSYQAGGPFQTEIRGYIQNSTQQNKKSAPKVNIKTAQEVDDIVKGQLKELEDSGELNTILRSAKTRAVKNLKDKYAEGGQSRWSQWMQYGDDDPESVYGADSTVNANRAAREQEKNAEEAAKVPE
tara:strand:+ start:13767 stop:16877 length:3111 start_codon:yes stop_codon:yes gene_type:complete